MIAEHLPILQVVVPLTAAPLCVALRRPAGAWALATLATWASLAIALALLVETLEHGRISYMLGGWAAPWGIEYLVEPVNAYVLVIVTALGSVIMPYALQSVRREVEDERIYLFYTMYLLALAGLLGIAITGDAFNLFVFLEISSLSSYALISLGRQPKALMAAYRYLILGTIGATFVLIGVGLLYMVTGTLNMVDLAQRLPATPNHVTVQAAFAFLTVGISLKLALFPLHLWLPDAYAYAPSMVSAFLAGTATKVAVYVLYRFVFTVFGPAYSFGSLHFAEVILALAVAAMFVASTIAIFQNDIKRMLAYSSVAQIGYIVLGLSFGTAMGLTASILHLFNHALIKGALFLALGCVFYRIGSVHLADMRGIARHMPVTMAAFAVGGLSLIGIPLTAGFMSKWWLMLAAFDRGWWPVAILVVLSSLLAVIYVWRVVEAAYFQTPERTAGRAAPREAPASLLVPTWLLVFANLYFGLETTGSVGVSRAAAEALIGAWQ